jgi:hypothetical protein
VRQPNTYMCLREARWPRLLLVFALLPALVVLNSCKGGGSSTTPATPATPTISVSCVPSQVTVNGTAQCTASITNLSSTLANWQAGGVAGGNSTSGTIDANGLYKAPANVPTNNVVTITAAAQAQTTLTATASVTILASAAITGINPSTNVTVAAGTSQAFTATVSGGGTLAVFWYVNNSPTCSSTHGVLNGNSTTGMITPQGNYVAPQIPPPGGAVTITAVSQTDSTQSFCVPVTLTFGNASLQGNYAFSTSGRVVADNSFFARAGSFTANGQGGLIGGHEDINPQPSGITQKPISFSGSYSIGTDGRGTMQFCEPSTSNVCTVPTSQFRIVVLSAQQAQIIEFAAGATANGEMDSQDASVFNAGGLSGTYTFNFSGVSSGSTTESAVGEFVADGDPSHTGTGKITSGEMDINNGGLLSQVPILNTSFYSISANGRGTATLFTSGPTLKFSFYMVSAAGAVFIEQDSTPVLAGDAFKQQSIVPWGVNALNGSLVLGTAGSSPTGGIADLGSFAADGAGNIVAGSGTLDQNNAGTVSLATSLALGGSYTFDISGNGRGTLTIPGHTYVFYMVSPAPSASAVVQETTAGIVAHGSLVQPQGAAFTAASFKGSYALGLTGIRTPGEEDVVGQLTADGAGKIITGLLDINSFGVLQPGVANSGTFDTSVASNGRTTMLLTPTRSFVLYFLNPAAILALGTDSAGPATAVLIKQF